MSVCVFLHPRTTGPIIYHGLTFLHTKHAFRSKWKKVHRKWNLPIKKRYDKRSNWELIIKLTCNTHCLSNSARLIQFPLWNSTVFLSAAFGGEECSRKWSHKLWWCYLFWLIKKPWTIRQLTQAIIWKFRRDCSRICSTAYVHTLSHRHTEALSAYIMWFPSKTTHLYWIYQIPRSVEPNPEACSIKLNGINAMEWRIKNGTKYRIRMNGMASTKKRPKFGNDRLTFNCIDDWTILNWIKKSTQRQSVARLIPYALRRAPSAYLVCTRPKYWNNSRNLLLVLSKLTNCFIRTASGKGAAASGRARLCV